MVKLSSNLSLFLLLLLLCAYSSNKMPNVASRQRTSLYLPSLGIFPDIH